MNYFSVVNQSKARERKDFSYNNSEVIKLLKAKNNIDFNNYKKFPDINETVGQLDIFNCRLKGGTNNLDDISVSVNEDEITYITLSTHTGTFQIIDDNDQVIFTTGQSGTCTTTNGTLSEFTTIPNIYTLNMYDSFGDSWNGNKIVFTNKNNSSDTYTYTLNSGSYQEEILNFNLATYNISWIEGSWTSEVSWDIKLNNSIIIGGLYGDTGTFPPEAGVSGGNIKYTPNLNYNGLDSFKFNYFDTSGNVSNTATASITVNPVNDAPILQDIVVSGSQGMTIDLSQYVTDVENDSFNILNSLPNQSDILFEYSNINSFAGDFAIDNIKIGGVDVDLAHIQVTPNDNTNVINSLSSFNSVSFTTIGSVGQGWIKKSYKSSGNNTSSSSTGPAVRPTQTETDDDIFIYCETSAPAYGTGKIHYLKIDASYYNGDLKYFHIQAVRQGI